MEVTSNLSKGFTDEDDEDDDFGRRESSLQKDVTGGTNGKNNDDQKATVSRSKHSVTEQRRRSKINDRFQILRDIIPRSDQKRDKASFLLEVIEYIQFLQHKIQSYETAYPGWNQDNEKLMPWVKVLFRAFWDKARKKTEGSFEGIPNYSQFEKTVSDSPTFVFSGGETSPARLALPSNERKLSLSEHVDPGLASRPLTVPIHLDTCEHRGGFSQAQLDTQNASASQCHSMRSCSTTGVDILNNEELRVEDGTISISSAYSQGVLNVLTHVLQTSGVDLSQASISVQINLGKRCSDGNVSNPKESENFEHHNHTAGNQGLGESLDCISCEGLEKAPKRHKP